MQMNEVGRLYECEFLEQANEMLSLGWTLVAVIATVRPNGQSLPCYILGEPRKSEPEQGRWERGHWIPAAATDDAN